MNVVKPGKILNERELVESLRNRAGRRGATPPGRRLSEEEFERELMLLKMTNEEFDAYVEKLKSERKLT